MGVLTCKLPLIVVVAFLLLVIPEKPPFLGPILTGLRKKNFDRKPLYNGGAHM